jgi:hypothetical protein
MRLRLNYRGWVDRKRCETWNILQTVEVTRPFWHEQPMAQWLTFWRDAQCPSVQVPARASIFDWCSSQRILLPKLAWRRMMVTWSLTPSCELCALRVAHRVSCDSRRALSRFSMLAIVEWCVLCRKTSIKLDYQTQYRKYDIIESKI